MELPSVPLATLSEDANPDWWKRPISAHQAQVLREATGLVLMDAIRFYDSGKSTREELSSFRRDLKDSREAIASFQNDRSETAERLETVVSALERKCNAQQSSLARARQDLHVVMRESRRLTEQYGAMKVGVSELSQLRSDNVRLHGLVESLTLEVEVLKGEYFGLCGKVGMMARSFEAASPATYELERAAAERESSPLSAPPTECLEVELGSTVESIVSNAADIEQMEQDAIGNGILSDECRGQQSATLDRKNQIMSLLKKAEREYSHRHPKSDTSFIWAFIEGVEDSALRRHIQLSLAGLIDERLIRRARPQRGREKRRIVNISPKLTWRQFTHALEEMSTTAPDEHGS